MSAKKIKKKKPTKRKKVETAGPEVTLDSELMETSKQDRKKSEPLKNPRHEMFCQTYAKSKEYFANGTRSYLEVYGAKGIANSTAEVNASRLLRNAIICERISELLSEHEGLNDVEVDKHRAYLIRQFENLHAKGKAIESYDRLMKRIDSGTKVSIHFSLTDLHRRAKQFRRENNN